MVQGCEKHLTRGTWEKAYFLAGVGEAVESQGFTYVYCSEACRHALTYDVRHACRKVQYALSRAASSKPSP